MTGADRRAPTPSKSPAGGPADCPFCQRMRSPELLRRELVYEDDAFHASHPINADGPSFLGSVLLQTKRHVPNLGRLNDTEARSLGTAVVRISRAIEQCTGAPWTYCYTFLEAVPHLHLFVVARYADLPKEHVRLGALEWPGAPRGTPQEVAELCQRLRASV